MATDIDQMWDQLMDRMEQISAKHILQIEQTLAKFRLQDEDAAKRSFSVNKDYTVMDTLNKDANCMLETTDIQVFDHHSCFSPPSMSMQMLTVPGKDGCDYFVDDGGDATFLIHKGKEFEDKYAKDKSLPDPSSTNNPEFKCILQLLKDSIPLDATSSVCPCRNISSDVNLSQKMYTAKAAHGSINQQIKVEHYVFPAGFPRCGIG